MAEMNLTPQQKRTMERLNKQVVSAKRREKKDEGTLIDDVAGVTKTAAKETGKFIMDNVISGDSWKDIAQGDATKGDYANAAIDVASVLVPGGALAGGAARMGGRLLMNQAKKRGAGSLAAKAVGAPASKAVEKTGKRLVGQGKGGAGKVGKQVGLAQSKRVAGRNALVLGAANVSDNLYGAARGRTTATGDPVEEKGGAGAAGGLGANFALIAGNGEVIAQGGPAIERAMAGYANQGGAPAGAQVVYLGG